MRRGVKSIQRSEHARELIGEIAAVLTYIFVAALVFAPLMR